LTEKPNKLQPALIGGVIAGLCSVIPIISLVNIACCMWAIIGGAVAAWMLIKRSPIMRVTNGEGAVVGMLSGIAASLLVLLISAPLTLSKWGNMIAELKEQSVGKYDPQTQQSVDKIIAFMQDNSVASVLLGWIIFALVAIGMATLGGIIGVALFEKRKGQPYPPQGPPPGYPPPGYPPPPNFGQPGPPPGGSTPPSGQPPY
jgi:hypothetical protein